VERSSSRAGLSSRCGPVPFTAHCNRLITTSLTRSAVSRYLGLFFHDFEHTSHVRAHALVPFEGSNDLASMICVQPNGLGPFSLHQFGGVAHQTSLRSRSIMMTYSNSPHSGRRVAYSVARSLRCRTTVVIWHSRMGFPLLPQLSSPAELFIINLVA